MQDRKQSAVESKRKEEEERRQQRERMQREIQEKLKSEGGTKNAGKPKQNGGAAKAPEKADQPDADVWTNEQQKQMENGMKEIPASVPTKERWIQIAEGVDGKTAKECFARFKELCAKAKAASGK